MSHRSSVARPTRRGAALLATALLVAACSGSDDAAEPDDPTTTTAAAGATTTAAPDGTAPTGDGTGAVPDPTWRIEEPTEHGFDTDALETAREYAFQEGANTQGVVVVHEGAIVSEWYADGADAESWAASWSMAKSVASATVGIAIEEGAIPGVDEPMTTWYPELADAGLGDLTLEDVLQMSSGQEWNENYEVGTGTSNIIDLVAVETDQLAYAVARPKEYEPGSEFEYSSGTSMLLSGVIEQSTGMPAHEYAQEKLFDPIGVSKVDWWRDAEGNTLTYCCLDTTSRDFARFGLLYLEDGVWGDRQVVPASWVEDSLTASEASDGAYGYQWWLDTGDELPDGVFLAQGFDGQFIVVVPSLDLIVVRNGTYVKDPGEPVADPSLFAHYPPSGLVEGKGTRPPAIEDWDIRELTKLVVSALPESD